MSYRPTEEKLLLQPTIPDETKTNSFYAKYEENIAKSLINENLMLSTFNTLISIFAILLTLFLLAFLQTLDYNSIITTSISSRNSSILINQNIGEFIFFEKYILINQTKIDQHLPIQESLLPKNDDNLYFVAKHIYLSQSLYLTSCLMIIFLLSILFQKYSKFNNKIVNIIFLINVAVFNGAFQIIIYYAIEYFQMNIVILFYVITLQNIIKITISNYSNQKLIIFCICFTFNTIFDLVLLISIGKFNFYLANYALVNAINNVVCMFLYHIKNKLKLRDLKMTYNLFYERQLANDLVNNMSVGYMKVQKYNIILNKSVYKFINLFANEDFTIQEEDSFHLIKDKTSNINSETAYTKTIKEIEDKQAIRNNKIYYFLDELFKQMKNLNENLPKDITDLFNKENIRNFNFNNLYNKFIQYAYMSEFIIFGSVDAVLKNDSQTIRKYQIMMRVYKDELSDKSVEMLFSDVTEIVEIEKEKAFEKCRSIYLSKIAHEFKNPLASVMELTKGISASLSNGINDDTKQKMLIEHAEFEEINNSSEHINIICKKMCQFIKDYSNLNNLKFKCEEKCKILRCRICSDESFCDVCKICQKCEHKLNIKIDLHKFLQNILKIFEQIKFFEQKDFIDFCISLDSFKVLESNTNYELLYSSVFNLLLFYYKNTSSKSSIKISLNDYIENSLDYCKIEFNIENMKINTNFLTLLQNESLPQTDSNRNILKQKELNQFDDDLLIKYFEVIIAFQMMKKIGNFEILDLSDRTIFIFKIRLVDNKNLLSLPSKNLNTNSFFSNSTIINQNSLKINYKDLNNTFHDKSDKSIISSMKEDECESHFFKKSRATSQLATMGKNILIIDDELLIRRTLTRQIKKISSENNSDVNLLEASNCFEALELIYKKIHFDNEKIDAIIVDEYMPYVKGSTFISFMKQISVDNKLFCTQIFSHTAFDSNEKKQMILNKGADQIINKPVDNDQLKLLINEIL